MSDEMAYAPHCDPSVLHSPGLCEYCDMYPQWQEYRSRARIAFSDEEYSETKAPCPSVWFRDPIVRNLWPGNQPTN